jgi:hypothetical protein
MRRDHHDRRLFRGAERSRLATLLLLLVMLCVLIPTVRSRTDWFRFFIAQPDEDGAPAGDAGSGDKPVAAAKTAAAKTSTAKTDAAKAPAAKSVAAPLGKTTPSDKTAETAPAAKSADPSPAKSADRPAPKSLADVPPAAPLQDEELEQARLKELLSVVLDGTLKNNQREMPAYYYLLKKAGSQPPETLRKQAREPKFNDFHQFAPEHRGELVRLNLNVRRIDRYSVTEENVAGVKEVYELWGWTEEAKAWLYVAIVPELPAGLKVGPVEERVTLVGYFFKLQAYHAGDAKPGARPMLAPAIIGRVIWRPHPPPAKEPWWMWAVLVGVVVVVVGFLAFRIFGWRRGYRRAAGPATDGRVQLGDWLPPALPDEGPPRPQSAEPGERPSP